MGSLYIVQYLQTETKVSKTLRMSDNPGLQRSRQPILCRSTTSPVVNVVGELCTTDVVGVHGLDVCVLGLSKLKARSPSVPDNVLNLLGDRIVVKRWQERESLKEPAGTRRMCVTTAVTGRQAGVCKQQGRKGREAK